MELCTNPIIHASGFTPTRSLYVPTLVLIPPSLLVYNSILCPELLRLYAAFEDREHYYLVQELVTGGDLYSRTARGRYVSESLLVQEVIYPLLLALYRLHHRRYVHRDIKPENIYFDQMDRIKLGEFGHAIDATRHKPVSKVGTLEFMAPEVLDVERHARGGYPAPASRLTKLPREHRRGYGPRADIWSLGVTLVRTIP